MAAAVMSQSVSLEAQLLEAAEELSRTRKDLRETKIDLDTDRKQLQLLEQTITELSRCAAQHTVRVARTARCSRPGSRYSSFGSPPDRHNHARFAGCSNLQAKDDEVKRLEEQLATAKSEKETAEK